jgi:hypothetical protein
MEFWVNCLQWRKKARICFRIIRKYLIIMSKKPITLPSCYEKIQLILAVSSGNKIDDIFPQANLITDLGLNLNFDLPEIIFTLNHEYENDSLNLNAREVRDELEEVEPTALELAKLVQEVRDLG